MTITVAPSASDDTDSTDVNVAITRDATDGVLDNDNGSSLTVTGHDVISAAQGVLVINADGGYTFTPATDLSKTSSPRSVTGCQSRSMPGTLL